MDAIQKLYSDIEKIKKHNRDSNGKLFQSQALKQICTLFENNNRGLGSLPQSLTDYWVRKYVQPEIDSAPNDISDSAIEKLCAMQAFLNGDSETDCLSFEDWQEIADAVNYEAEDLPMDLLSQMMSVIVEKKAL